MKKFLSVIVSIAIMLLVNSGIGAVTPVKAAGNVWYVDASVVSSGNGTTPSSAFKTITEGINAASNGDTIHIANGTYNGEPSTITINKELSIIGESEGGVVIDASSYGGYGVHITASNVTMKNFTLKNAKSYGIKSEGANNLDYENLTVENSGRSNIDFNGCSHITLNHITARNSSHGVGIAITDSNNATVSNIKTSGNVWGNGQSIGMAVYTYGRYYPGGSSNITLSGTNSFGEPVPLYVETGNYNGGSDYPVTNLGVSGNFASIVRLPATLPHQIYFFRNLNAALAAGAYLASIGFADAVTSNISDVSTNGVIPTLPAADYKNYFVGAGMHIQSAVFAAANGDAIFVMPGTYTENVLVDKSVTLKGAANHASIIKAQDTQKAIVAIRANGVTVDGFTIQDGIVGVCIYNASEAVIKNNIIKNYKGYGYHPPNNDPVCPFGFIGEGILLNNGEAIIHKNTIEAGEDGSADPHNSIDSIYLKDGSFAKVTENILRHNHYGGSSCHASASGISLKNNSNIIAMGNTIYDNDFGIHPEIKKDHTVNPEVVARYNNIYENGDTFSTNCLDGGGFVYEKDYHNTASLPNPNPIFDATYNWWGENDESGPYNAEANPSGHGDKITTSKNISISVSDYIVFDPWAGKTGDKTEGITEGVTGGTASLNSIDNTFENGTIGMGADVAPDGSGSSDVMLVKYSQNPTSVSFNASFPGAFFDLNATQPANLDKIVLKLYYPANHGNLAPFWFDKTANEWKLCSNWQVVPGNVTVDTCNVDNSSYAGYVAVTIDNTTSPTLSELTGTYFALGGFKLTVNIVGSGTVTTDPDPDYYSSGTVVTLTANPSNGWQFSGYSGDISTSDNPVTITMDSDKTVTATFKTNEYTVTFNSEGGSSVPSQTVPYGENATKPADPTKTGYTFAGWYKDEAYTTQWDFDNDVVTQDITLYAKWTINQYTVTFNSEGGSSVPSQTVPYGGKVTKPADPTKTGYTFAGWYKDEAYTTQWDFDNDVVTQDITLYAKWTIITYTITASAGTGGSISPLGNVVVNYGASQTFTITPDAGYMISKIIVDGKAVYVSQTYKATYTFKNVKSNHTIRAEFVKKPKPMFEVTAKVEVIVGSAKVTPKVQTVPSGSPAKVTINPEAGYHITEFKDNGKIIPLSSLIKNPNGTYTYKIDAVYEDHYLLVTLERDKFVISVKTGKGGTVSPSGALGNVTTYYGENKTFKITPENGYKIDKVIVDGKEVNIKDGEYTFFAVKANHSIEVLFKKVSVSNHQSVIINLKIGSPFISVNGVKKTIDAQGSRPIIKNNRTLLPIRVIIESLGGSIRWNGKTREVTIELNGHSIVLKIGNSVALVDGIKTKIDPKDSKVVPIIVNGRTYLPLRFIAEHLGATVDWDGTTRTVTLYYWP